MNADLCRRLRYYLVTDSRVDGVADLVARCDAALSGGMTAVQLRVKDWSDRDLLLAAELLRELCAQRDTLFVMNDRVDIALAVGADGAHLGASDLPVTVARRLMGDDAIIGYSPETESDRVAAEAAGASYLGVGPVYTTATKDDAGEAIGLDGLRRVVEATPLPVVGIGGIGVEQARDVLATGAAGVAIVSAVFMASDPAKAARRLVEATS
ncbi:MAG TPA: thiamine phosphate synthase [Thermomicrobiales bacterium]|nr:thiamine phosphate synthase [Thermomicrobiales bacterium]